MLFNILMFVGRLLWRMVRWSGRRVYQGLVALHRRRRSHVADKVRPRIVYTGKWQVSDNTQFCGRPVVLRMEQTLRPGVELLYFGEENAEPYYSERCFIDEGESVTVSEQMLQRFLGGKHRRPLRKAPLHPVAIIEPVNDEVA